MATTPPILKGPSDKEKKYDRQLRLWAANGQQALEDAHILLINSGSGTVGVETLKNLVLPGIGKFTIWDEGYVTEADLGVNFFLDEESLGKSRAESCMKLLVELNADVKGDWYPKADPTTVQDLLSTEKYTLIIRAAPTNKPEVTEQISKYSEKHSIPLITLRSAGFYSSFQVHLPSNFPIVDTHPDSTATTDLRLLSPWPELSDFATTLTRDLETQSAHDHGHIPYVVLLLHYLKEWQISHGSYPTAYADKKKFREFVAAGARTDTPEGAEENYDEAIAAVLKTVSLPILDSGVKAVFDYSPDESEAQTSFWIIADSIKQFHKQHNELPLPGSVPDMKAQSSVYVQLQNIYKTKARQDVAEVLETVRSHPYGNNIETAEVETFCKNAAFIKLIHKTDTPDLAFVAEKEFQNDAINASIQQPLSLLPIHLALCAADSDPEVTSSDILTTIANTIGTSSLDESVVKAAEEVARAKGGELHNISALTGGMVSQEVIKIITKQYIPIDNTCIFDGIKSRTQVLRI